MDTFLKEAHNLLGLGEAKSDLAFSMTDDDLSAIDARLKESDEYVEGFADFCRAVKEGDEKKKEKLRQKLKEKTREVTHNYFQEKESGQQ